MSCGYKRRVMELICSCGKVLDDIEFMILDDVKDFTKRKMFSSICKSCLTPVVTLSETRKSDNKVFVNENIIGKKALQILTNEQKRVISRIKSIPRTDLYGWVYGVNVQIKNRKGQVTQVRQYASDFFGNKKIIKKNYPTP